MADAGPAARMLLAPAAGVAAGSDAGDDHRTLALALLGIAQLWSGELDDAAGTLERARADAGRRGRDVVVLAVTAHLALLEAVRGRLTRSEELARQATGHARRVDWSESPQLACADLALAVCAYHRDDLAAAVAALDRVRAEALAGDRPVRLAVAVLAAWMAAGGGAGDAETALARLDAALGATGGRPPRLLRAAARAGPVPAGQGRPGRRHPHPGPAPAGRAGRAARAPPGHRGLPARRRRLPGAGGP